MQVLPPVFRDREKIDTRFANGVLTVTMPKSVAAATKKIEVKPSAWKHRPTERAGLSRPWR
jgi:hypothetical protein